MIRNLKINSLNIYRSDRILKSKVQEKLHSDFMSYEHLRMFVFLKTIKHK